MSEPTPSDNIYVMDLPPEVDDTMIRTMFQSYSPVQTCKAMPGKFPGQKGAALVRFNSVEEATWIVQNLNHKTLENMVAPIRIRFAARKQGEPAGYGKSNGGKGRGHENGFENGIENGIENGENGNGEDGGYGLSYAGKGRPGPYSQPGGRGNGKGGAGSVSSCDVDMLVKGLMQENLLPGSGRKPDENCLYITGLPFNTTDRDLYKIFGPFGAIPATGVKAQLRPDGTCSGAGFVDFNDATSAKLAMETLNGTGLPDGVVLSIKQKWSKPRAGKGSPPPAE